jgi:hypothetical protein
MKDAAAPRPPQARGGALQRGRLLLPLVAVLALAACAAQPGNAAGDATGSSNSAAGGNSTRAENDLVVELDRGDGSAVERYTLTCGDTADGDHPASQEACDHLAAMEDPFAPLSADKICAQVYDGPQTAYVTGRWRGEPVDLHLARNDGCRIAQWDGLGPLLPG